MTGQSYVLLALGLFAALVVTVAGVERYLMDEHPPEEVGGLLWRVANASTKIRDLEMHVSSAEEDSTTVRMHVRILGGPVPVMSVEYLEPTELRGQIYTVQRDLLSFYVPATDTTIVRRWMGVPLAAVGLAALDVSQLEREWKRGRLVLQVVSESPSAPSTLTSTALATSYTVAESVAPWSLPAAHLTIEAEDVALSFAGPIHVEWALRLPANYLLEVRNPVSLELERTIWVDSATFLVRRVVFFEGGVRRRTVNVEDIRVNGGMTSQDVLTIPRGGPVLRG